MKDFCEKYPAFKKMYDRLVELGVKFDCKMDPELLTKLGGCAGYSATTGELLFRANENIKVEHLQEELIHAIQHREFYQNTMHSVRKNVEFEAKIVQDQLMLNEGLGGGSMGDANHSNEFMRLYESLIYNFTTPKFHEVCNQWQGYKGSTSPDFIPKVVLKYSNF